MKAKLSIVIPAYNEASYIRDTLASLQKQSYKNLEIIVVDNNSSDDTAQIAQTMGVKVVKETRSGVCAARQAGLQASRGSIIVTTDADTTYHQDWLANINKAFDDPAVVAVGGAPEFVKAPFWGKAYSKTLFGFTYFIYRLTGKVIHVSASNLAYRKNSFEGYNTSLTQGGDELYVIKQLRHKGKIILLKNNPVYTSSRRLKKGILYNAIITGLGYYLGDYMISRFTKKSVLGSYEPIRDEKSQKAGFGWQVATVITMSLLAFVMVNAQIRMAHAIDQRVDHSHLHLLEHRHIPKPDIDLPRAS